MQGVPPLTGPLAVLGVLVVLLMLTSTPTLLGKYPCPFEDNDEVAVRYAPAWSGVDGRTSQDQGDLELYVTLHAGVPVCVYNPGARWVWSLDANRSIPPGWSVALVETDR